MNKSAEKEKMFDFQKEVIEKSHSKPILVDFWAPWCAPCKYMGPVLNELQEAAGGKWELVKVNVDTYKHVMDDLHIKGIPMMRLYHKGKEISGLMGAVTKEMMEKWLELNLPYAAEDK